MCMQLSRKASADDTHKRNGIIKVKANNKNNFLAAVHLLPALCGSLALETTSKLLRQSKVPKQPLNNPTTRQLSVHNGQS